MTEQEFQRNVVELAHLHGWLVMHTRPAFTNGRWVTPIQGDAGYPDLTLARGGRVIFAELKSERGRLSPEQNRWLAALGARQKDWDHAPEAYVWRPKDWDEINRILKRTGATSGEVRRPRPLGDTEEVGT